MSESSVCSEHMFPPNIVQPSRCRSVVILHHTDIRRANPAFADRDTGAVQPASDRKLAPSVVCLSRDRSTTYPASCRTLHRNKVRQVRAHLQSCFRAEFLETNCPIPDT